MKVELCNSLSRHFKNVVLTRIELTSLLKIGLLSFKIVNTNIRYDSVKNKIRPIAKNAQGVVDDIEKLKETDYLNKSLHFVAFPIHHNNENWQIQLRRISGQLAKISYVEFDFEDKIPGVL